MKTNEKRHRRYLRKRRMMALRAVLRYENGVVFRADYGFCAWVGGCVKTAVCILFGLVENDTSDKEVFVSYDNYFNVDHYNWTSVCVNPSWLSKWRVSIIEDGE
ncbi:MAG: hypothetical protein J6X18_08560 [Bacteroidales bacterium]|nr:hypothetical protein [Bacteroidales bacterium]